MFKKFKLLFETKENLQKMNEELIEKSFVDEKTKEALKEYKEELKMQIKIKDDLIKKLNDKNLELRKRIANANTDVDVKVAEKEQPKKRGRKKCQNSN